jgi:predicted enzyme related to lactoylglutathione lyase
MKLKYIPVFTDDMDALISFYSEKLGFTVAGKMAFIEGWEGTVLEADNLPNAAIVVTAGNTTNNKACIILSTDDCLADYHLYKTKGLFFCTAPRYLPAGMQAEFLDPAGNLFVLLEERNYNEL